MATTKAPKVTDFKYVDAWHSDQNGKSAAWTRLEVGEVTAYQQEANNYNAFCTVQRFANKVKTKGEAFIAPLYFDLDYEPDPSVSQADAVKLVEFFMQELDVQETDIYIYFSGSKGFHVLISSQALGIEPAPDLHKAFKHIAGYTIHRLGLRSLDTVVYTAYRMLRLPNSIHAKTRLFKIEISIDELRSLSLDEIKNMASMPRKELPFTTKERKDALGIRNAAAAFYEDKLQEYSQAASTANARYEKEEFHFVKGRPPACVQDILNGGWKKEGDRNQATVQLACYYKDAGHTQEETTNILTEWVIRNTSAGSDYQVDQRIANTRSVIDAVYSKDNNYKFGCAFIRSLHGEKHPGSSDYERVACAGPLCHAIKKNHADDEEAVSMHLSQTADAELTGSLVTTKVMVAGKKHTPYIVPKKIEYYCWGRDGCKKTHCPLYDIPSHTLYKDLGVQDRELIQMAGNGDDNIKHIIKSISGIPQCAKFNTEVVEQTNVNEMLVIPMASESEDDLEERDDGYVLRRIYAIGDMPVTENKYYEVSGYVYPHPKNAEATILLKNAKPLQDVVESFEMTDDVKEMLAVFQPADYTAASIEEKLTAVLSDLTYNVTHIVERDETLLGVLLTYHSVLRFRVPWDLNPIRGWVEMKVVGDTGTGKSALIEKIMKYAGLGTRVNAESTSRTGLTYKMEQSGNGGAWYIVWGAWALADKEMIWIDEDTGISKDDYGEMTLARSDGKLEVKRAVTAETTCRVRAILSGNVPKGKRLADYAQGVESLRDVFNNEDIRRFDFAVFMRSTDVPAELYNQTLPTYPSIITSDTLKASVLFSWSRTADDVVFMEGTVEKILEVSTMLSKLYGNANDVPLVSPSDQRNKVARLAVALASLTHSVDESGNRIQVWVGHVEFIGEYLKAVYNAPGCALNYYAKLALKEEVMTQERYEKLTNDLRNIDTLRGNIKFFEFIKLFAQQKYLRLSDVEAMLSIERDETKAIVNMLTKMRMVQMTSGGYRKTPRFNAYIAYCMQLGLFDDVDDDY